MASKCASTLDFPRRIKCPKSWKSREEFFKVVDTFFATSTHFSQKGEIFLQDSRFQSELDCIQIHLNEKYNRTNPKETDLLCAPGDLCIAKYLETWFNLAPIIYNYFFYTYIQGELVSRSRSRSERADGDSQLRGLWLLENSRSHRHPARYRFGRETRPSFEMLPSQSETTWRC